MTPAGSMRPAAIAASIPLTSSGAAAEMRWTLATRHGGFPQQQGGSRAIMRRNRARSSSRQRGRKRSVAVIPARSRASSSSASAGRSTPVTCAVAVRSARPATNNSCIWRLPWHARTAARRGSRSGRAARPTAVPVEHQEVGGRARRERAAVVAGWSRRNGRCWHAIRSIVARSTSISKPDALCRQMRQPHFAQRILVLVEATAVEAHGDAAAAPQHLAERRNAGAKMRFELVLTTMVAPRSAISSSSSGRAQMQCASVDRG